MSIVSLPRALIVFATSACLLSLASACAIPIPKPTPTLTLEQRLDAIPTATPHVAKTMAQVQQAIAKSPYMDNKHISKGLTCQSCHVPFPPQGAPDPKVCLSCHGGTFSDLAAKTSKLSPNPHKSHLGEEPCTSCHYSHGPFVYLCHTCHDEYTSTRFQPAGDPKSGSSVQKPGTGSDGGD